MGTRENKELLQKLHAEGFPGPPEKLDQYFLPNYIDHMLWKDLAGLKNTLKTFHGAYPSATWKIEDIIAEGDRVVVRCEIRMPMAIGKSRTVTSTAIYRIDKGKIAESWGNGDPL